MSGGPSGPPIPRCPALTRLGVPCQRPATAHGRCAFHRPDRASPAEQWRIWTLPRRFKLMDLLAQGKSDRQIAARLCTTVAAVRTARKRYGLASRASQALSARAAARRLGLGGGNTVAHWVRAGYLRGRRAYQRGPHQVYWIEELDVLDFLEDPAHWHRYDVERIADPGWKAFALECRGEVRLLRAGEAAHLACIEITTLSQWIRKGFLPARKRGANWIVRSDDLAAVIERRERTGSPAMEPAGMALRCRLGERSGHGEVAA